MTLEIILVALVLIMCIAADKFSGRFGMPALILFIGIGMLFGCDGIAGIEFDNFTMTEYICNIALGFIMFYGGFNTKWKTARPVAVKAVLLSTCGVILTAAFTMLFCYFVLRFPIAESFLVGAVLSATDAASVFAILRRKKLNLKDGVASLLEIESGSNDPIAYMLTVIGIYILNGDNLIKVPYVIFAQIVYGVLIGIGLAVAAIYVLTRTDIIVNGLDTIFILAVVLLGLGLSQLDGGNEFLCIYLFGILLGNSRIRNKGNIVPFFDGVTTLAQIVIFFMLGLLSYPHRFLTIIPISIAIAVFLTFIARPAVVFAILKPFKCSVRQCLLVSWAGLRGASSIVFSIVIMAGGSVMSKDLFNIVFMISLLSVAIQGTLLPAVSRRLDMIDETSDVRKTFNDYQEESSITLMRMFIPKGHNWENKLISEVHMPTGAIALMIKRGRETIITRGNTKICGGDNLILSIPAYENGDNDSLEEINITSDNNWCNRTIRQLDLPENLIIALVKRGEENIIPSDISQIIQERGWYYYDNQETNPDVRNISE